GAPLASGLRCRGGAGMAHCRPARLFEAAGQGVRVLTDAWLGIDGFFRPGEEILLARTTADVLAAIDRPTAELAAIGRCARGRVLAQHTAPARALELGRIVEALRPGGTP